MSDAAPDWINGDPVALRRWRNRQPEVLNPDMPDDVVVSDVSSDGAFRGGLLFSPSGSTKLPAVVHFHGGGFVVGSPWTHRVVGAWIAHCARRSVLMPRYRLAPEHPIPALAADAAAALRHALAEFGGGPTLSGDSAGTMVALWGFSALSKEDRRDISSFVGFYGVYGSDPALFPGDAPTEAAGLGRRSVEAMYARVDPLRRINADPSYSPLHRDFPLPTAVKVIGAAKDPLLSDSLAFADAHPEACGKIVAEGHHHGFLSSRHLGPGVYGIIADTFPK